MQLELPNSFFIPAHHDPYKTTSLVLVIKT